jgi:hypothetical protein
MEIKFAVFLLLLCSFSRLCAQTKFDSLRDKNWKFESYITKGHEVGISSEHLKYTLKFDRKKRFSGVATYNYWGRYTINRTNEIVIKRLFIPKSTPPNTTNSEEFEWRLQYGKNLGYGEPIYYEIKNGYLKLHVKENYIMVFKSIE